MLGSVLASLLVGCSVAEPPCVGDIAVWEDLDKDGYGGKALDKVCKVTDAMVEVAGDCDDQDEQLSPAAIETCDGVDNDCDGEVDDDANLKHWWFDGDGDKYGGLYQSQLSCEKPGPEWVANAEDCDDNSPAINPDAQEICGRVDEDCDGYIDESDDSVDPESFSVFYADKDGDGYGDPEDTIASCRLIVDYVLLPNDCNDRNPQVTQADFYTDADADGYGDPDTLVHGCRNPPDGSVENDLDCDDGDAELLYEADWFDDPDGDGWGSGSSLVFGCVQPDPDAVNQGGDCDEADPLENPGTPEDCSDGIDNNCDLRVDESDPTCLPPCADEIVETGASGSTVNQGNDITPSCAYSNANDYAFGFTAPSSKVWTFTTLGSNYDSVLTILDGCGGAQLGCNDDYYGVGGPSRVDVYLDAGDQVVIDIDGYATSQGNFTLGVF